MKYSCALYHKLMLYAGVTDSYDEWLNKTLEQNESLEGVVLELSFCSTDREKTISVLNEYLDNETEIELDETFDYIWRDLKKRWISQTISKEQLLDVMYLISTQVDVHTEPWQTMNLIGHYYELAKEGHCSKEACDKLFEGFLSEKMTINQINPIDFPASKKKNNLRR